MPKYRVTKCYDCVNLCHWPEMTHRKENDFTVLGLKDSKLVEGVFQVRVSWTR